jgi:hypothetical protein
VHHRDDRLASFQPRAPLQALSFARLFVPQVPELSPLLTSGYTHWFAWHQSPDWQALPSGRLSSHCPALQKLFGEQASSPIWHGPVSRCGAQVSTSQNAPATQA